MITDMEPVPPPAAESEPTAAAPAALPSATSPPAPPASPASPAWDWRGILPIAILVVVAFAAYTQHLDITQVVTRETKAIYPNDHPNPIYWDEEYYVMIGHQQAQGIWKDPCWDERPQRADHPPLARLIMTASIKLFDAPLGRFGGCLRSSDETPLPYTCYTDVAGHTYTTGHSCFQAFTDDLREHGNPYAWRMPGVVLATLAVACVALTTRKLLGSTTAGVLAGAFLLMDGVFFVAARMTTLDIYAAGFAAVALYCATFATWQGRLMAGLILGLAFASKYTAFFAGVPVLVVLLWSHHRAGKLTRRTALWGTLCVTLLPGIVWLASYAPWWIIWVRGHGVRWAVDYWVAMQRWALEWNQYTPLPLHPEGAQPYQWFLLHRPMYFWVSGQWPDHTHFIYSMPNPIVWWGAALAGIVGLAGLVRNLMRGEAPPRPPVADPAASTGAEAPVHRDPPAGLATPRGRAVLLSALWPGLGLVQTGRAGLGVGLMLAFPAAVFFAFFLHTVYTFVAFVLWLAALFATAETAEAHIGFGPAQVRSAKDAWRALLVAPVRFRLPGTDLQQRMTLTLLLLPLCYAGYFLLTLQSFIYYFSVGIPFLAIALGTAVWHGRRRPEIFGMLGGGIFLVMFGATLYSLAHPELRPGAAYVAAMTWAGVVGVVGLFGWAYPAWEDRAGRVAQALFVLLAFAAFAYYFPLLEGLEVGDRAHTDLVETLPWVNK